MACSLINWYRSICFFLREKCIWFQYTDDFSGKLQELFDKHWWWGTKHQQSKVYSKRMIKRRIKWNKSDAHTQIYLINIMCIQLGAYKLTFVHIMDVFTFLYTNIEWGKEINEEEKMQCTSFDEKHM